MRPSFARFHAALVALSLRGPRSPVFVRPSLPRFRAALIARFRMTLIARFRTALVTLSLHGPRHPLLSPPSLSPPPLSTTHNLPLVTMFTPPLANGRWAAHPRSAHPPCSAAPNCV